MSEEQQMQPQQQQQQQQPATQQGGEQRRIPYFAAVASNRETLSSLRSEGVDGFELFERMAGLNIAYRVLEERASRCPSCWYCVARCVCDRMPRAIDKGELPNAKFLLLMHHKEYLNAGNSAKSLLSLLPDDRVELYVYGREGDFARLIDDVLLCGDRTLILWPGPDSRTVEEFLDALPSDSGWSSSPGDHGSSGGHHRQSRIQIVVLDGTYNHAKNMHKMLKRKMGDLTPPCVALHPTEISKFHRAQKRYGASFADTLKKKDDLDGNVVKALRISTAEACALLLAELGAAPGVQERILQALLLNNVARS